MFTRLNPLPESSKNRLRAADASTKRRQAENMGATPARLLPAIKVPPQATATSASLTYTEKSPALPPFTSAIFAIVLLP